MSALIDAIAGNARDRSRLMRERLIDAAGNAFDWLFVRDSLVKSGLTPFEQIYRGDPMSVRHYVLPPGTSIELADGASLPVSAERHATPLVLVPPLGVTSETFDLLPQRSLVRYMAASGFDTYLIDWGRPRRRHAHFGMQQYALEMMGEALAAIRLHSGAREVSLMGWCMGGLLCLIHLGVTRDPHVRNLITVASPIDMRGGGLVARAASAIDLPVQLISRYGSWRMRHLDWSRLHVPGWLTSLAFKMTDPVGSITTYWDLLTRMWDREFVESHTTTADYLNNMLLYPGGVLRDLVMEMAVGNKLAAGRIEIGGRVAELKRIKANLLVFAGDSDHLVSPALARRSLDLVSSQDKQFHIASGGHMSVILGAGAPHDVWASAAEWLSHRSGRRRASEKVAHRPRVVA
jgi:polyhydroxyalkanoate synthase